MQTNPKNSKVGEVVALACSFVIALLNKAAPFSGPCPIASVQCLVPVGALGITAVLYHLRGREREREREERDEQRDGQREGRSSSYLHYFCTGCSNMLLTGFL